MDSMEVSYSSIARTNTLRKRQFSDYTIVFFCPLVVEQQAACLMLDEIHDDEPPRNIGQTITYTFGRIASYNVAIAAYPGGEAGIGISGSMVAEARRDFGKHLEFGVLVGIAAGTPSPARDIRLGDVAVAYPNKDNSGVIGYDQKKVEETGDVLKQWQQAADPLLRSVMNKIQVHEFRPGHDFRRHLIPLRNHEKFRRPTSLATSPEFGNSPKDRSLNDTSPKVHYGTILSGNGVIKNKTVRDVLRDRWDAIAIEMEAAGMTTRLGVAVVRGISDFADSNKNDDWHAYAAIVAAAYAKELVIKLGSWKKEQEDVSPTSVMSLELDVCLSHALPPSSPNFVGRETELEALHNFVTSPAQKVSQANTLTVFGLGGVGKSQLVAEFVGRLRHRDDSQDIFWITGETKETFEQSIASMLKGFQRSADSGPQDNYREKRTIHIDSFFAELKGKRHRSWILVIDGVPGNLDIQRYINGHLQRLINGSTILTTRDKNIARSTSQSLEVKGLSENDGIQFLQKATVDAFPGNEQDLRSLVRVFKCHPLSLNLAASAMSQYLHDATEYVRKWKRRELEYGELPAEDALSGCFEVSFAELQEKKHTAAMLLMLFGYLDHSDMWLDLCQGAVDDDDFPPWLQEVAKLQNPQQLLFQMRSLSFIEAKQQGPGRDLIWEIHPVIHEFSRHRAKAMGLEEELVRCAVSLVAAKVPRSQDHNFLVTARRLALHAEQCKIYLDQNRTGGVVDLVEMKQFGDLFRHLGRYDDASQFYEYTLRRLDEEPTLDHSDLELTASLQNNLGLVYHHRKEYADAVMGFEASRKTYFQILPNHNSSTMSSLYNTGRSLMMQNELDQSLSNLEKAAAFFKPDDAVQRKFRREDESKASVGHFYYRILNDIGEILLRKNDIERAEKALQLAFKGQSDHLGEHHPATFPIRLNLGRICVKKGRFGSAKQIFQYVIATYMDWWGRRHSETMRAVEELADAQAEHGAKKQLMGDGGEEELQEATNLMEEVAKFHSEVYGDDSDSARTTLVKLQTLQDALKNGVSEDEYAKYYSAADVRRRTI